MYVYRNRWSCELQKQQLGRAGIQIGDITNSGSDHDPIADDLLGYGHLYSCDWSVDCHGAGASARCKDHSKWGTLLRVETYRRRRRSTTFRCSAWNAVDMGLEN